MSNGAVAGGAAAAAAAIAQAIKASGAIIKVETEEFMKIVSRGKNPLIVVSKGGFLNKAFDYLTGYKGFVFYTRSDKPLYLPGDSETILAKQIWIPS